MGYWDFYQFDYGEKFAEGKDVCWVFFVLVGERKGEAEINIERKIKVKVKRKIEIKGEKINLKISFHFELRTYQKYWIQTKY